MKVRSELLRSAAWCGTALLSACGGGGGGVNSTPTPPSVSIPTPTPSPIPAPTPTPAPAPAPTPTATNYDTSEYRATVGAVSMNALAAYNRGATGLGVNLAIIDSGIDTTSAEFGNRISTASQDVAGNTSITDQGGHGTAVAFTAAGRRNDTGTLGVAFDATITVLRADTPGSCTATTTGTESPCKFSTDAIARGVDAARVAGARVINMSLGGSAMPQNLVDAISRATAQGIIIVIAAGNDGSDNPDPFTAVASDAAARNLVIIAGSVGTSDAISSFSDKAGTGAAHFLAAVGERVRAPDQNGTAYLWSGTSFAAPQISGAIALLAQAFPNLSGAQIVDLLFRTARDVGATGVDSIYGNGVLDLTKAFQPVGTTALAGSKQAISVMSNATLSAPMGDAQVGTLGAVILDSYARAFAIDLARTVQRTGPQRTLTGALATRQRNVALDVGGTTVSMTLAPQSDGAIALQRTNLSVQQADTARAIAATVTQQLGANTRFGFAIAQGGGTLSAQLAGRGEPAFLVAGQGGAGFDSMARSATALRQQFGAVGVTAGVETGDVLGRRDPLIAGLTGYRRSGYARTTLAVDTRWRGVSGALTATRLTERDTLLGARFDGALGAPRAASWFVDADARADLGDGWTVGANWRRGWTNAQLRGGLSGGGTLRTTAFAADVGKDGVFGTDSLGLRIAQPLRVTHGGLDYRLPTGWDYATLTVSDWTTQRMNLTPTGRELDIEARYRVLLGLGDVQANLFWRRDPGNFSSLPDDRGAAVRYAIGF